MGSYLIERRGTPKLTESGVLFYNYAKQTLNSYECVCGQISNLEKGIEGKITVAAGSSVSKYLLPNVSRKMHQKYPNINIDILYCKLNDVFEHILNETADIGFSIQTVPNHNELVTKTIARVPEILAVNPRHPLRKNEFVEPSDLLGYDFVISDKYENYIQIKKEFLQKTGISIRKSNIIMSDFDMAKRYVKESNNIIIGPRYSFNEELKHGDLVELRLKTDPVYSKIKVIYKTSKILAPSQKNLLPWQKRYSKMLFTLLQI